MKTPIVAVVVVALVAGAGYGGYRYAMHRVMNSAPAAQSSTPTTPAGDRKVLYWYDPMVPQQKFDKPGKSPFMDMQLVPKYPDEAGGDEGKVTISSRVTQNLGVRTAEAKLGSLEPKMEAVG